MLVYSGAFRICGVVCQAQKGVRGGRKMHTAVRDVLCYCCGMLDAVCRYRSLDRFRSCEGFSRPSTEIAGIVKRWEGPEP